MKAAIYILIVVIVILGTSMIVRHPSSAPGNSLSFAIETSGASNALPTECKALISNTSPYSIEYYGGGETFFAICTNDVWEQIHIHTLDCGFAILRPGHSVTNIFRIPPGATKFKVGFPMTSLTWRGNTAWYLAAHFPSGSFRFLGGFLLQQDESKRNGWGWSDEYSLTNLQASREARVIK